MCEGSVISEREGSGHVRGGAEVAAHMMRPACCSRPHAGPTNQQVETALLTGDSEEAAQRVQQEAVSTIYRTHCPDHARRRHGEEEAYDAPVRMVGGCSGPRVGQVPHEADGQARLDPGPAEEGMQRPRLVLLLPLPQEQHPGGHGGRRHQ